MKKINALLVFLISSLVITGISFVDGRIWDIVFLAVGLIAYAIVGILFSVGILSTKKQGRDAYALFFFLLILGGYGVYKALETLRNWMLSWPVAAKITVPSILGAAIIVGIVLIIIQIIKNKKTIKEDELAKED